jgi:hypothetical protein
MFYNTFDLDGLQSISDLCFSFIFPVTIHDSNHNTRITQWLSVCKDHCINNANT